MNYREPCPSKEKEMRLLLTRGEVHAIVMKHLLDTGRIPRDAQSRTVTMPALETKDGGGYLGPEQKDSDKKWDHWVCYGVSWIEPVPDEGT